MSADPRPFASLPARIKGASLPQRAYVMFDAATGEYTLVTKRPSAAQEASFALQPDGTYLLALGTPALSALRLTAQGGSTRVHERRNG